MLNTLACLNELISVGAIRKGDHINVSEIFNQSLVINTHYFPMDRTHLAEEKADNSAPVLLTLLQKKRTIQTQQILDFLESEAADISDSELSSYAATERNGS